MGYIVKSGDGVGIAVVSEPSLELVNLDGNVVEFSESITDYSTCEISKILVGAIYDHAEMGETSDIINLKLKLWGVESIINIEVTGSAFDEHAYAEMEYAVNKAIVSLVKIVFNKIHNKQVKANSSTDKALQADLLQAESSLKAFKDGDMYDTSFYDNLMMNKRHAIIVNGWN